MDAEEQRTIGGIVPFKLDLDAERRADQELELINVYMDWGLEFDLEDVACSASGRTAGSSDEVDDVTDGDAGGERKGISVLKSVEMLRRRESASSGGSVEEVVLDRDRGWRGRVVLFDAGREVLREVDAAGSNEVLDGRGMVVFEEDDDEALERTIDELNWWEEQRFREWRYEELQTSDVLEDDEALDALVDEMNQVEERLETEERMRVPRTMAIATALSLREGACVPASMSQQECENDLRDVLLILDQFSHHDLNDRTKTSASFRAVDDFVAAIKHKAHWALHGTCDGLAYHLDPDWVGQFLTTLYKIADLQVTSATSLSAAYPSQGMLSDPMMWKVWVTQQLQRLWKERYAHGLKRERRILDRTETEAMLVDNSQRLALVRSVRSQLQTKVLEDSKKDILEGIKNQCSWGVNETVQEIQSLKRSDTKRAAAGDDQESREERFKQQGSWATQDRILDMLDTMLADAGHKMRKAMTRMSRLCASDVNDAEERRRESEERMQRPEAILYTLKIEADVEDMERTVSNVEKQLVVFEEDIKAMECETLDLYSSLENCRLIAD